MRCITAPDWHSSRDLPVCGRSAEEVISQTYLNGWISKDEVLKVYEVLKKNQYGQYLKDVLDGKYQEHLY